MQHAGLSHSGAERSIHKQILKKSRNAYINQSYACLWQSVSKQTGEVPG
jgi:hypothetical protein